MGPFVLRPKIEIHGRNQRAQTIVLQISQEHPHPRSYNILPGVSRHGTGGFFGLNPTCKTFVSLKFGDMAEMQPRYRHFVRRTLEQMGVSCVYESCTNHRPQSSEAKVFGLYQKSDPNFLESAGLRADPSAPPPPHSHRFLARIPEPQSRVPNLAHLP